MGVLLLVQYSVLHLPGQIWQYGLVQCYVYLDEWGITGTKK